MTMDEITLLTREAIMAAITVDRQGETLFRGRCLHGSECPLGK